MITPIAASAEFVCRLNSIRLEEEEIASAIRAAIEACDSGESYVWSSIGTAMQLFPIQKARAVIFRLQALVMMMERKELRNWTESDGIKIIPGGQKALIAAVASHPLSIIDGSISFEKESFIKKIIEFSEPPGNQRCC